MVTLVYSGIFTGCRTEIPGLENKAVRYSKCETWVMFICFSKMDKVLIVLPLKVIEAAVPHLIPYFGTFFMSFDCFPCVLHSCRHIFRGWAG